MSLWDETALAVLIRLRQRWEVTKYNYLESVSEPLILSGRLFQSISATYENTLPPLVDLFILGTINNPEFWDLRERDGL